MTISLKHLFTSAKADGTDATLVQPSNWNEEHVLTQAPNTILGRATAGTGPTEEISLSASFTLAGGTLDFVDGAITPAKLNSITLQLLGALTDPGADSIVYWDNTANDFVWLTLGTGLAISGGALNVDVGGLADGAVTEAKIATSAVTEAKIAPGSVTVAKISSAAKSGVGAKLITGTPGTEGQFAQFDADGDIVGVGSDSLISTTFGGVGTYVFATTDADVAGGEIVAGSALLPTGAAATHVGTGTLGNPSFAATRGSALMGSWRCMGTAKANTSQTQTDGGDTVGTSSTATATLWLRIA
jgi:hypothetical protein